MSFHEITSLRYGLLYMVPLVSWTSLAIGYTAMPQIFSSVVPQTKYTPYSAIVSAQFTYSWTLPIALAVGSVQLRLTDTQNTAFPLLSVVFVSSACMQDYATHVAHDYSAARNAG